jgi:hypothetical protein
MRTSMYSGIVALFFCSLAGSSSAGTLEVSFAFDQGIIRFGVVGFVSEATSLSGTGRVLLTGVNPLGMLTGPSPSGSVRDVSLMFAGPAQSDRFRFEQEGMAAGTFNGAALPLVPGALVFRLTTQTGLSALFSNEAMGANLQLQSLGAPGDATLSLSGFFQQMGSPTAAVLLMGIQGREVSRRFSAPEGPVIQYLVMGLIALMGRTAARGSRWRGAQS